MARNDNNRGEVRRAQGNVEASLGDFEKAIEMQTRQVEEESKLASGSKKKAAGAVKLNVAIGCSEKVIDPVMQLRPSEQEGEGAVVLGMSLKNRGYAYLVQGKLNAARKDFEKATEIYATLVYREGQRDLVLELARSMGAIGWIFATHPDDSTRDGRKAKEYALEACELSEWKALAPVETLAAACAAAGDFRSAVQWQQKAVELAPGKYKEELRNRLELYKSGSVYRIKQPG